MQVTTEAICRAAADLILEAENADQVGPVSPGVALVLGASLAAHLASAVEEWFDCQDVFPAKEPRRCKR